MHGLEHAVDAVAAANGFSGVVRVDRGDDVELASAYGLAHRGYGIANAVDTQLGIASGTKGLTAVAIASLIEDGSRSNTCCPTDRASATTWTRKPIMTSLTT